MKLLIVESPTKCKTIGHYLGEDYLVESSAGHIRDLKIKGKGGFGVDIENNFQPEYEILRDKKETVERLKGAANIADHIYLATDLDREGEAISWHLSEVLAQPKEKVSRIVFNEITKNAILKAIKNDRDIDMNLVHSQESRRILDRIIGFRLSSLLQQKIGSKSAGRVQSVVLKLVVEREKEIQNFDKVEYWDLSALLTKQIGENVYNLKARFYGTRDSKLALNNEEETNRVIASLKEDDYRITNITKKERTRASRPPFITSTLQQDAGAKFNYNAKRVMMIAQKLYEGVELGKELVGLITYMRTDSTRLADEFVSDAKKYIIDKYGEKYFKGEKKVQKGKNIQDAHEAIRPTNILRTPESVKNYLRLDEYKIYSLIYNRTIASLMSDAILEDTKVDIENQGYLFNLSGEITLFDGFKVIYEETSITDEEDDTEHLPELEVGEALHFQEIIKEQKFTSPPSRYTEARLIRRMEELGIGRPSTYALTMETLKARAYVSMEKKTFMPSSQGILTSEQLELFFSSIINVKYTADMEMTLDKIADGKAIWYEELRKFYDIFVPLIENARDNMVKLYPKITDEFCPECGLPLFIRRGPFGEFTACSGYPHCKYIKKTPKKEPVKTGVICPTCGEGEIVERTSARGRSKGALFYACSLFPKCKATFSGIPTGEKCPVCGAAMIQIGDVIRCNNERCKSNEGLIKKEEVKE